MMTRDVGLDPDESERITRFKNSKISHDVNGANTGELIREHMALCLS